MKAKGFEKIIICILGGFAKKDPAGIWHTADQYEGYNQFGTNGHRIRILAGNYLHQQYPDAVIIVSGGKGKLKDHPDMPPVSRIMKEELEELGVPARSIREENKSGNTYEQLVNITKLRKQDNSGNLFIVTNTYHLPRVQAFLDHRSELQRDFRKINFCLVSADDTVSRYDAKLKRIIKKTYACPEMKVHIALEQKGIEDIKSGKYKLNS